MNVTRPIFFLTDFGTSDPFVGVMKAVAIGLGAHGPLVDLSHDVPPQDILVAALMLEDVLPWLPDDAVVCAVVDPGVGTGRRPLAVKAAGRYYIAPDNGLLEPVYTMADWEAREITAARPINPGRSATFHGRDVFAPAAALLALDEAIFPRLGNPIHDPVRGAPPRPRETTSAIEGVVLHFDRFGNAITSLRGLDLADRRGTFEVAGQELGPLRRTYGEVSPGAFLVYTASNGRIEIAVRGGNARETLGISRGDTVCFRLGELP